MPRENRHMSQGRFVPFVLGVCSGIFLHMEYPKEVQTFVPIVKQWLVSLRQYLDDASKPV